MHTRPFTWGLCFVLLLTQAQGALAQQRPISAICVEAESGLVLFQQAADIQRPPASMVKLIMMLMVAEGLQTGKWTLETPIQTSAYAASMQGTQVFLKAGEVWPLSKMMDAIAVASANDASAAVAETLWGGVPEYLQAANLRAVELGMIDTTFRTANGLPPANGRDFDITTARDMAILARACVQHDIVMTWCGQKETRFRPNDGVRSNTNKLLDRMEECDGLKTGFIRAAGFCIAATAQRDGIRLISVVMGNPVKWERFNQAQELLENGFQSVQRVHLVAAGQPLGQPVPVSNSHVAQVQLAAAKDLWVTVRKEDMPHLKILAEHPGTLLTPITSGSIVGEVRVQLGSATIARCPLTVPVDLDAKAGPLMLDQRLAARQKASPTTEPTSSRPSLRSRLRRN